MHTCTPTELVRKLEEENAALKEHVADHQLLFKDYAAAQHRIKVLREASQAVLDAMNNEAKAEMTLENAGNNFTNWDAEDAAYCKALVTSSEANRTLLKALALHDSTAELDAALKEELETTKRAFVTRYEQLLAAQQENATIIKERDYAQQMLKGCATENTALKEDYKICKHSLENLKHDLIYKNARIKQLREALEKIEKEDPRHLWTCRDALTLPAAIDAAMKEQP